MYRITVNTTSGVSPSELLMGKRKRSKLDLIMSNKSSKMESKQMGNKQYHDWHAKEREFNVGEIMFVYCYINKLRFSVKQLIKIR